ncbi:hypothetical protein [Neobacillus niacini]|uniref:hypothetical protein n=1 Tax=Neobacillus niacini TaxID=86668 RepID=UPI0039831635
MSKISTKSKVSASNILSALQPHHKSLLLYGLTLVIIATVIPSLSVLFKEQLILLPYSNGMVSHPVPIILFVAILLISAMTFVLIGATHGHFLTRFTAISIVAILLLFLSQSFLAVNFILLPIFFIIGYLLWRGSHPLPGHPTVKDIQIIFFSVFICWGIVNIVGTFLLEMGVMVTIYIGVTQLIAFAVILPIPLIILSGVELANVSDMVVEKIAIFSNSLGKQVVLILLFITSLVKLGFNLWKIEWHSISSLFFSFIFLIFIFFIVRYTPKHLLQFQPKFKHWLMLIAVIHPVPVGLAAILILFGVQMPIDYISNLLTAAIGPISLVLAGILFYIQRLRAFSIFIVVLGIWLMLTFSLKIGGNLLFGFTFNGLTLWGLDGVTAFFFIIWSILLLYQRRSSPFVTIALKFSVFLSCCFVIDQLLNNQVALAELYTLFQILTFLVVHQIIAPKRSWWIQLVPWVLVAVMFAHNIWNGIFPNGVMNSVKLCILTIAMLWDVLMSEEKIRGEKVFGPQQPGLLFIYLGYALWTVAQVVYAKTGKGATVFDWEPMILFGFLFIGIPWVFYLLIREVKTLFTELTKP